MGIPITPAQTIAILKKWGLQYKEYKDWEVHNRNKAGPFKSINGVMLHHTGSDSLDQRELLYKGRDDLPGPLAQFGVDQAGVIHLIGNGRANHAGDGDPAVLRHVIDEDYTGILKSNYHEGSPGAADGNAHFYGIEVWYSGSHLMTPAQMSSMLRLAAGICDHYDWKKESVICHSEWSDWKWDPGYANPKVRYNASILRSNVGILLKEGPKPAPIPTPVDPSDPINTTYRDVFLRDCTKPPAGYESTTNPHWAMETLLRNMYVNAEKARKNTEAIMKHLGLPL